VWLAGYSTLAAIMIGFSVGYSAAAATNPLWRNTSSFFIDLSLAIPVYWTGTLVVFILATAIDGLRDQPWLPVAVLAFHTSGAIARLVQAQVRDATRQPYVQVAIGKGLKHRRIQIMYILRPMLVSVLPVIVLQFGYLLSGAVITESIFQRSGIGTILLRATLQQDYPVVQGIVLLMAMTFVLLTLFADVATYYLDPRLQTMNAPFR
jgi:ABC-type dipeptide/oligopeptide/nickel transport system permease component